ncbi:NAD-dependent phenylacetaldehyde dehydrogenase, partial [Enterobacter hormaechei]|nr:NAD-dependent phenylacetaldehyde dehydrogenase [Enterobacter hormaechei]
MSESHAAVRPGVQQFLDRRPGLGMEGRQAASDRKNRLTVYTPATGEVIPTTADA